MEGETNNEMLKPPGDEQKKPVDVAEDHDETKAEQGVVEVAENDDEKAKTVRWQEDTSD